jgi:hypothetical protein
MLKAKYECWKKFHIWVTGMTVDGELNPGGRPIKRPRHAIELEIKPWEADKVSEKRKTMRAQLRTILCEFWLFRINPCVAVGGSN